ncbi:MAG: hypothetical protein E8D42_11075 [Nitrospira sp.]|nr:MAG: hypothetical protein E8D42_11075 [Nitrospira sp.]
MSNVLNALPKANQPKAKSALHQIWMADTKHAAHKALEAFVSTYAAKYPKAPTCLVKDRNARLALYDFPAEPWGHIRTTNPIESRLCLSREYALDGLQARGCGGATRETPERGRPCG